MSEQQWQAAREAFAKGVFAYPTEAVFGLGCDPSNDEFIEKLLDLKQRVPEKGLILLAADYSQVLPYIDDQAIGQDKRFQVFSHWPGPVTLILPAKKSVSTLLTGGRETIAVRVTAFEPARELCRQLNSCIVSTSANLSGKPAATTADEVKQQFDDRLAWIMPGPTGGASKPSKIIDPLTNKVLRDNV
ncbi:L-threonylcarbamoyladenylate synthase type 1 TsaC [Idiomarina tyrosinivorans]|uniref:Threonylcarbamoyl-AMP synthase n=1 Tax=Idiomarina tyrosinivorans TaxID=1445662 RepID=A0A432ZTD0_9GAMM|nr:Sua5/YciO/YrdC/YwlC family protein [Idiomarina tyrosinivorans]RUO81046.1 L-threonylcarbamoyladenylate synthase type 1 TsaC [Idiomarina tyrosinivorans]